MACSCLLTPRASPLPLIHRLSCLPSLFHFRYWSPFFSLALPTPRILSSRRAPTACSSPPYTPYEVERRKRGRRKNGERSRDGGTERDSAILCTRYQGWERRYRERSEGEADGFCRESEREDNLPWCKYIVPRGMAHLGAVLLDTSCPPSPTAVGLLILNYTSNRFQINHFLIVFFIFIYFSKSFISAPVRITYCFSRKKTEIKYERLVDMSKTFFKIYHHKHDFFLNDTEVAY